MKRLVIAAATTAALAIAAPAFAQSATGTINVTGTVQSNCTVITGGSGSSFSGTIGLGELDGPGGTLSSTLINSTSGAPAGAKSFQVTCNGSDATVTLSANQLAATGITGTPDAGTEYRINYSTDLKANLANSTTKTFTYNTTSASATTGNLTGRLANAANNLTVSVYGLHTNGSDANVLDAGSYTSTISVNIAPIA